MSRRTKSELLQDLEMVKEDLFKALDACDPSNPLRNSLEQVFDVLEDCQKHLQPYQNRLPMDPVVMVEISAWLRLAVEILNQIR